MKVYNYTCTNCKHTEEYFVSNGEIPEVCTHCHEIGTLERDKVQPFNISRGKSDERRVEMPIEMARAIGGEKLFNVLRYCPVHGLHKISEIWKVPLAGRN